ncbi:MAG: hypothetical protein PHD82_01695 [Candidatus Riflebacteria bacterium]|nr:hypothetical protein [Candidatus Riflebacteria bacterium]
MNSLRRSGSALLILFLLIVAAAIGAGGFAFYGNRMQKQQTQLLAEGFLNFSKGDLEQAYGHFVNARSTFSSSVDFYRKLASGTFHTRDEINEVIVSLSLSIAHEKFFNLDNDAEWVKKAEKEASHITDPDRRKEITQNIATANEIVKLLQLYKSGDYQKAMKDLLEVENKASTTDQDFFIFEIRFLIACGKALREPAILNQARELLFFATTDAGIENEKTRQLWGLLTR